MDDVRIVDVRGRRLKDVEMKCVSKRAGVGQPRHLIGGEDRAQTQSCVVYMRCFKSNARG